MTAKNHPTLYLFALLLSVSSHPQCVDFLPPFTPQQPLSYCQMHSTLGCCTADDDDMMSQHAGQRVSDFDLNTCTARVKDLICSQCSEWSQHLYDRADLRQFNVSSSSLLHSFPAMCPSYCHDLFTTCSHLLHQLVGDFPDDVRKYCDVWQSARDSSYCYPFTGDASQTVAVLQPNATCKRVCLRPVASDLRNPLAAVAPGDGTKRLFIIEQIGVIHILQNNQLLPRPFLDISKNIMKLQRKADERGLLGMAFHPNFRLNGRFFVYYSTLVDVSHVIRVSEFLVSFADKNVAEPFSERVVLEVEQPRNNHNGGQLLFGDDGFLYIFLGDGGGSGDPFGEIGNGQNRSTLLGSILRIDIDTHNSTHAYSIPPCNPFVGVPGMRPEIYSYGLRNPWRCSFDRGNHQTGSGRGRLFCGDVGQSKFEEVNIIEMGGNYGWRGKEGFSCYRKGQCNNIENEYLPIFAYNHKIGKSVTGGYVYRGCQFPSLRGKYIFGDFVTKRLFALSEDDGGGDVWEVEDLCLGDTSICHGGLVGNETEARKILSFGEDEDGELYVLAVTEAFASLKLGTVFQIVDPSRRASPEVCATYHNRPVGVHPLPPIECSNFQPTTSSMVTTAAPTEPYHIRERKCDECKIKKSFRFKFCHYNYDYGIQIVVNQTSKHQDNSITITSTLIKSFFGFKPTPSSGSTLHLTQSTDSVLCRCRQFIPLREYIVMGHFQDGHTQPTVNTKSVVSKWASSWQQKLNRIRNLCGDEITAL